MNGGSEVIRDGRRWAATLRATVAPMTEPRPLSHLDAHGHARMVDVGAKPPIVRRATACGDFVARRETLDRLFAGQLPKGEALGTARIAGILAAKRCDELIPLCHTLPLDQVGVEFERVAPDRLRITATASTVARTGVEMEALVAVSTAALTLWDMTKAVDDSLRIDAIRLLEKRKASVGASLGDDAEEPTA